MSARPRDRATRLGLPSQGLRVNPVWLLGVKITPITLQQLLVFIEETVLRRRRAIVAYANVRAMNLAYDLPWFRAFLNQSDIVFCDGFGVKWAAPLARQCIPERFTPPDWLARLAQMAAQRSLSLFLLGARPGVTRKAARRLTDAVPTLNVVGTKHGYFDKTCGSAENDAVIKQINAVKPDILIVGFGMPLQERWLMENWDRIDAHVALTGGAVFDYVSGEIRRAPRWMTDHGLEWLGRLIIEPRRLWRRYLIGNPLFFFRVLRQRIRGFFAEGD